MIKYKGNTSNLLKDLSVGLTKKADLKLGEDTLKQFFCSVLSGLSREKKMEVICNLPAFLKPFCAGSHQPSANIPDLSAGIANQSGKDLFSDKKIRFTNAVVFYVLEKYVDAANLAKIYSCFPAGLFCLELKAESLKRKAESEKQKA